MVPPLGRHYSIQWKEDDQRLVNLYHDGVHNPSVAANKEYVEVDDTVYDGDLHIGPLSERVVSAFIKESIVPDQFDEDDDPLTTTNAKVMHRTKTDLSLSEERLKSELVHIGLLNEDTLEASTDTEVTRQLQAVQNMLKQQIQVNVARKQNLSRIAEEFMAYQEYNTLLDDINKTVEAAYTKRFVCSSFTNVEIKLIKIQKQNSRSG
jgi:hypothetical protein